MDARVTAERLAAGMVAVGFPGRNLDPGIIELLRSGIGGVVLFARNAGTSDEVRNLITALRAEAPQPILVAVDQEGGRVQRLRDGFTPLPSLREIGALGETDGAIEAKRIGRTIAAELAAVGIDLDFAPVVDVDSNPENPVIGPRSFGSDPRLVATLAAAMIRGMQEGPTVARIAACAKHFPGHGDTDLDSHHALPHLRHDRARVERIEWPPFRAAIDAGVAAVMTAHIVVHALDPAAPATLSRATIGGALRGSLGFGGAVISDDLRMRAVADTRAPDDLAVAAADAGCDLLLVCADLDAQQRAIAGLARAITDGRLPESLVHAAQRRVARLRTR